MVPVISFIGYHNSGKTTVATKVVKELRKKGYTVAVLKSTKHRKLIGDTPGKDSYRYREAGAGAVGIVSPDEIVLFQDIDRDKLNLEFLSFLLFGEYDIVICEGFKRADVPKIEVTRKELGQPLLFKEVNGVVAVVSDFPINEIKNFSFEDVELLTSFIEENFIKQREDEFPDEVELFINGKRVSVEHYVKKTIRGILYGFIEPLKKVDYEVERIDVRIVKGRGKNS